MERKKEGRKERKEGRKEEEEGGQEGNVKEKEQTSDILFISSVSENRVSPQLWTFSISPFSSVDLVFHIKDRITRCQQICNYYIFLAN